MSNTKLSSATEANDKNLVKVKQRKIGKNLINAVDARELHSFLESKRGFSNWIKYRIEQYGFLEGIDFKTNLFKNPNRGRSRLDYALSLDMAKELCMIENTEKGKQARQYFIECERKVLEKEREKVKKLSNHVPKPENPLYSSLKKENKSLRFERDNYKFLFNTVKEMYERALEDYFVCREENKIYKKWHKEAYIS